MLKVVSIILFILSISLVRLNAATWPEPEQEQEQDQNVTLIHELTEMYLSSMYFIFKNQDLINQQGGDKSGLFGDKFIVNVKKAYQEQYQQAFPNTDHRLKVMLLRSMIEVMQDNKTLIYDDDLAFKGFIPAMFAFQLSVKLSSKGLGVKIKFTNIKTMVRNPLNYPDQWEVSAMEKVINLKLKSHLDKNQTLNAKKAYRYFYPIPLEPVCLDCHGRPQDNPINVDKDKSQWSNIDITGFVMDNWQLGDFSGGLSVSIYKDDLDSSKVNDQ